MSIAGLIKTLLSMHLYPLPFWLQKRHYALDLRSTHHTVHATT
jgi:hypothetical protein